MPFISEIPKNRRRKKWKRESIINEKARPNSCGAKRKLKGKTDRLPPLGFGSSPSLPKPFRRDRSRRSSLPPFLHPPGQESLACSERSAARLTSSSGLCCMAGLRQLKRVSWARELNQVTIELDPSRRYESPGVCSFCWSCFRLVGCFALALSRFRPSFLLLVFGYRKCRSAQCLSFCG